MAVERAVPVEAPKGSIIVFHGATWHGAFPRKIPGMRISIANYYRHLMVTSQEDFRNSFDQRLAEDCADPELFKVLSGFDDEFPYAQASQPIPRVVDSTSTP
jgi:ectoine hydroxylase-related dioxygenase (phytanoyl-CoA dioxygenase family)